MSLPLLVLDWPLDNWQIALAGAALVVILILFIAAFKRSNVSRAEFARLQAEVKQLSEDVRDLLLGEQKRFLKEIGVLSKRRDAATPKAALNAHHESKSGVA